MTGTKPEIGVTKGMFKEECPRWKSNDSIILARKKLKETGRKTSETYKWEKTLKFH